MRRGKLRKAAYSAADIGTVTPLTNNGELTSIPAAYKANPLRSLGEIEAINETLSQANAGGIVTLPSGIGFCLYIKQAALEVLDRLPDHYGHGYYEDVDYCLRLRDAGFRNVCATDVYIGHKGSASFKSSKRAFVVRNLRILSSRFPDHSAESAAFMKADPLAAARALLVSTHPEKSEELSCSLAPFDLKAERTALLRGKQKTVFHLDLEPSCPARLCLRSSDDDKWVIHFACDPDGFAKLGAYLQKANIKHIELSASAQCTKEFVDFVLEQPVETTLLFDGAPIKASPPYRQPCLSPSEGRPCAGCSEDFSKRMRAATTQDFFLCDVDEIDRYEDSRYQPHGGCRGAKILHRGHAGVSICGYGDRNALRNRHAKCVGHSQLRVSVRNGTALADLDPISRLHAVGSAHCGNWRRIGRFAAYVRRQCLRHRLRIAGRLSRFLRNYQIGALLFPQRWAGFTVADRLSENLGCPQAYFDWSFGAMSRRDRDLAIDPRVCDDAASRQIASWVHALFLQHADDGA